MWLFLEGEAKVIVTVFSTAHLTYRDNAPDSPARLFDRIEPELRFTKHHTFSILSIHKDNATGSMRNLQRFLKRKKKKMVGASGFEPPTSRSRTVRSTKLSHAPIGSK